MAPFPARIGNYDILRGIGSGGMGTVYLGQDAELKRPVAIKVLRDQVHDPELLERFFREAHAAAALRHPNIITVYTSGQHDYQPFIAMEFVDGESLADAIRHQGPLTLSNKLSCLEQICSGLHFAHRAGIVHRDVKPAAWPAKAAAYSASSGVNCSTPSLSAYSAPIGPDRPSYGTQITERTPASSTLAACCSRGSIRMSWTMNMSREVNA